MKKFMTVLLGMSLMIGSAALAFGDDPKPAAATTTTPKKAKKHKKKTTPSSTTPAPATAPTK
jgi:hypothetical protein